MRRFLSPGLLTVLLLASTAWLASGRQRGVAQEATAVYSAAPVAGAPSAMPMAPTEEQLSKLPPEVRARIEEEMRKRGVKPGEAVKPPGDGEKKPDGPSPPGGGPKPEESGGTIKRPTSPDGKPDRSELEKAKPDNDGKVQFNFHGQPWTEVLQWFADVSGSSLDWQELPGDFLNLTTNRKYTIAETRDLLNLHLLARGFTMLRQGEVLTVAKIEKLDPSLVPTVDADELEDYAPHDFVKTRFEIPESIDPAKAADDVKALLSPAAKVTPLLASKRLLVIDAVANLRSVRNLFYDEELTIRRDVRPRVFPIRYRRADYVADQIMIILGIDVKKRQSPQEMQMEMQAQQQRMQMMQQMQGRGDAAAMAALGKKEEPKVHIAVDKRRNVLLVNAEPREMAIIERTIREVDVPAGLAAAMTDLRPSDDAAAASSGDQGGLAADSSDDQPPPTDDPGALTLEKYQTVTAGPDGIISALQEVGGLSPLAQLQADSASKTIFAYATARDHQTIKRMLDKLDGSGRGLHVIWLNRRSPADQVAGTIHALMVGEEEEDDNGRRGFIFFNPWGNNQQKQESKFRVQADVENNRLLLWASEAEHEEVQQLLAKLGAVTKPGGRNLDTVRVLEPRSPEETAELLQRLRQLWGQQNPLEIAPPPAAAPADEESDESEEEAPGRDRTARRQVSPFRLAAEEVAAPADVAEERPAAAASGPAPPVKIAVDRDGRLVIHSDDPAALDELEDLINEIAPARRQFEVFPLKNARASSVAINLEEYFADELAEDDDPFRPWWWDDEQQSDGPTTLGKRRKLRFIWDPDTNTIVAQNASPAQLEVVRKLIKIYDQPIDEDSVAKRRTEIVHLHYSRASTVAAALKEVYRDLLSSKDKEFQGRDNQRGGRREVYYRIGNSNDKSSPVRVSFEGALSVGVDELSNSLIVSAEESVYDNVREIITLLDERAKPNTVVQVHELRGALRGAELQKVLSSALAKPWPGGKPEGATANNAGGGQNGQDRGDRGRGRRGRDR